MLVVSDGPSDRLAKTIYAALILHCHYGLYWPTTLLLVLLTEVFCNRNRNDITSNKCCVIAKTLQVRSIYSSLYIFIVYF